MPLNIGLGMYHRNMSEERDSFCFGILGSKTSATDQQSEQKYIWSFGLSSSELGPISVAESRFTLC
jgi:hypothetical protein